MGGGGQVCCRRVAQHNSKSAGFVDILLHRGSLDLAQVVFEHVDVVSVHSEDGTVSPDQPHGLDGVCRSGPERLLLDLQVRRQHQVTSVAQVAKSDALVR
eukprot:15464974-Heterocapsa_arctica.AAC.1